MDRVPLQVLHFPEDRRPVEWRLPVVAVGNFDGVHRGHQKILDRICRRAGERGGTPLVLTFDPHPPRIVRPDKAPPLLMTAAQKMDAIARAGVVGAAVVRFTHDMSQWEPDRFVRTVLVDWLHVAEVWVGANFLFGRDRTGNYTLLRVLGAQYGFRAEKIDPVRYKEFVVSSTRIRRLVTEGRVDEAAALLGHHYQLEGTVVAGDARGRLLGFPTANLAPENELLPPNGVYATLALVGDRTYTAVTNIGTRPTFEPAGQPTIETHLFEFDGDLYGRRLCLALVLRLRDERQFPDVDALTGQIDVDCQRARELFRRISLQNREGMTEDSPHPGHPAFTVTVTVSSQPAFVPTLEALTSRIGEYVGCPAEEARHLGAAVRQALTRAWRTLGSAQGLGRFTLVFQGSGRLLRVDMACPAPLPAGTTLQDALGGADGVNGLRNFVDRVEFGDTHGCPYCRLTRQIRDAR